MTTKKVGDSHNLKEVPSVKLNMAHAEPVAGVINEHNVNHDVANAADVNSTEFKIAVEDILLPSATLTIPYESLFASWHDALYKILLLPDSVFTELKSAAEPTEVGDTDFLNLSWEQLLEVPVDPHAEQALKNNQLNIGGGVVSQIANTAFDVAITSTEFNQFQILSVPQSLPAITQQEFVPTVLVPVVPNPTAPVPGAPTLNANGALLASFGLNSMSISEFYLNSYAHIQIEGHLLTGTSNFGFNVGATAGNALPPLTAPTVNSIDASFSSFNVNHSPSGTQIFPTHIILTTPQGNSLEVYTANDPLADHVRGDLIYTINDTSLINGAQVDLGGGNFGLGYEDQFLYSILNSYMNSAVGQLNFFILDDKPVTANESGPTAHESAIENGGSNHLAVPEIVGGQLLSSIAAPSGTLIISPGAPNPVSTVPANISYFGADKVGAYVSMVTMAAVSNATADGVNAVTQVSNIIKSLTAGDVAAFASVGINNVMQGDNAILITDSVGNTLLLDQATGAYIQTINHAYVENAPASPSSNIGGAGTDAAIHYQFQLTDGDGSQSNISTLTIGVKDDIPIAFSGFNSVSASGLANGSGLTNASLATGTLGDSFGADGKNAVSPIAISLASTGASNTTSGALTPSYFTISSSTPGFSSSHYGDPGVSVSDGAGNTFIIDLKTFGYSYALQSPLLFTAAQATEIFTYQLIDADGSYSSPATVSFSIFADPPAITKAGNTVSYTDGQAASVILDSVLKITDGDSAMLNGAVVKISNGYATGDLLNFSNTADISGSYSNGTLTLSGTASLSAYQAALESITFSSMNGNATNYGTINAVQISWQVTDTQPVINQSSTVTSTVDVFNSAPVVATSGVSVSYTDGQASGVIIDPSISITDTDSLTFSSAKISISSGFTTGDKLNFSNTADIKGSYNSTTGVLTLTGTNATVAEFNAALQSITFSSSNANATAFGLISNVGINWQVTDSNSPNVSSNIGNSTISIVNAAPIVTPSGTAESYTDGQASGRILDPSISITDSDSLTITSAKVSIASGFATGDQLNFTNTADIIGSYNTATGVLTLTGTNATVAEFNAALQSITFSSNNANATAFGLISSVGIHWQVNDSSSANSLSNIGSSTLTLVNAAPSLTPSGTSVSYTDGQALSTVLDPAITLSDSDSLMVASAKISIATGFAAGDQLNFTDTADIIGSYNSTTGVLTLTGTNASVAEFNAALQSITFSSSNANATLGGSISSVGIHWQVTDINSPNSVSNVGNSTLVLVNAAPTVTPSGSSVSYTDGQTKGVILDPSITIADTDSVNVASAKISIASGFTTGDQLNFTNTADIKGSYNSTTGVLTLTGTNATVTEFNTALHSISFSSSNANATGYGLISNVGINWQVTDSNSPNSSSNIASTTLTLVNAAPTITPSGSSVSYTDAQASGTVLDPSITITDSDSLMMTSAKISISSGFATGDQLNFTNTADITGSYNSTTGELTLSGTNATIAEFNAALQSITFSSSNGNATAYGLISSVGINWQITDSNSPNSVSNVGHSTLALVNAAPSVTPSGTEVSYTDGQATGTILDPSITIIDNDSLTLMSATITFVSGYTNGDQLNFTDTADITGSYNSGKGVLTLTGTNATLAEFNAALQSITFSSSHNDATSGGTISSVGINWQVTDNTSNVSNVANTTLSVYDAPVLSNAGNSMNYVETQSPILVDNNISISDHSSANITGATINISANFSFGDVLSFTNIDNIVGSYDATNGILTLSGTDTLADYQTALESILFSSTSSSVASRTISWNVIDANDNASNTVTSNVNVALSPIVLDLSGDGIHLTCATQSGVTLGELSGTTNNQLVGWITQGEGVLMLNSNGNGLITNINQIAFSSYIPGAQTDLQGLAAFDSNHDGKLDVGDQAFREFGVLLANSTFESLTQLGITSISLTSNNQVQQMNGNTIFGMSSYQTANGQTHLAADVAFGVANPVNGNALHASDVFTDTHYLDFTKLAENNTIVAQNNVTIAPVQTPTVTDSHQDTAYLVAPSQIISEHLEHQINPEVHA